MDLTPGPEGLKINGRRARLSLPASGNGAEVEVDGVRIERAVRSLALTANPFDPPRLTLDLTLRERIDFAGPDAVVEVDEATRVALLALGWIPPAEREAAYRAGREDAARDIQAHADEHAPADGNEGQRRLRRHLLIGMRVAAGPPTDDQIRKAIAAGNYAVCHLDEAGQSINLGRSAGHEGQHTSTGSEVER